MSTRISSAALPFLSLAACQPQPASDNAALTRAETQAGADDDGHIVCATGDNGAFARQCTVERTTTDQGLVLTVRRPDGGFHRLLVTKDGRGVIAADGAEKAKVTIVGDDQIEVAIGGDRYRLPATVKGKGGK